MHSAVSDDNGRFVAAGIPERWDPDPNRIYTKEMPAGHVLFFAHPDYDGRVGLPPGMTDIDVPVRPKAKRP
jgi:hypothetical protein